MNSDETSTIHEEALLSEDPDVLSGGNSSTNDTLLDVLQSFNMNIAVKGESLRSLKQQAQTPTTAESAKKRKSSSTGDDSDSEVSEADKL